MGDTICLKKACLHKNRIQFPNFGAPTQTFLTNDAIMCHVQTKGESVTKANNKHSSQIELAVS